MHNAVKYKPNRAEALTFLSMLEPENTTDTVFNWRVVVPDKPSGFGAPLVKKGKTYDKPLTFEEAWPWLCRMNLEQSAAIFVGIQATDGKGAKKGNVNRIRALFVDVDYGGWPKVEAILDGTYPPNLLINTSPDKWHCYWQTSPDFPVDQLEATQKQLIAMYDTDKTCHDLARVMRVPGFYHHKAEPYLAHCGTTAAKDYPPVTHHMALEWLGAPAPAPATVTTHRSRAGVQAAAALNTMSCWGWTIRQERGGWQVHCPWKKKHTDGRPEAMYWEPSADNNYAGGFKCLHDHCADRDIKDLLDLIDRMKEYENEVSA